MSSMFETYGQRNQCIRLKLEGFPRQSGRTTSRSTGSVGLSNNLAPEPIRKLPGSSNTSESRQISRVRAASEHNRLKK